MDAKTLAHNMYNCIQKQFEDISQDPVKSNCGWRPRLYFFSIEEFGKVNGVTGVCLGGNYVILRCENESVRDTVLTCIRDAAQQIGAKLNANGYCNEFDGVKYYSVAFNDTPEYVY